MRPKLTAFMLTLCVGSADTISPLRSAVSALSPLLLHQSKPQLSLGKSNAFYPDTKLPSGDAIM